MSLGQYIREQRLCRGLSQWELARLSGLGRSHLSRLELDDYEHSSAETFLALARALKVHPNDLYEAAGYVSHTRFRRAPTRAARRTLAGLEVAHSLVLPVTKEPDAREDNADRNACWAFPGSGSRKTRALLVEGFNLKPEIEEGDVIFIDPERVPSAGNVVLCCQGDKVTLARHEAGRRPERKTRAGRRILGVVVGVSKKLA